MRKCEDCKIILDGSARYCPKCGKNVASGNGGVSTSKPEVGALLASANLHRIRQEWDAAILDATEALKLEPNNSDITSVLGDIYEQRGMYDESLIWYQMALEINPDSASDKLRLEQVRKRASSGRDTDSFGIFQSRARLWTAIMAGAFVIIVALALFFIIRRPHSEPRSVVAPSPGVRAPHTAEENSTPDFLSTPQAPTEARAPRSEPLEGPTTPISAPSLRTSGEARVNRDLQNVQDGGIKTDDVIADPRQGVVIVTFSVPTAGPTNRSNILLAAAAVAKAAFASNTEIKFVTARCVVSGNNGASPQIAFVGDIARVTEGTLGTTPSPQDLDKAFTRQWWNPQVR